MKQLLFIAAVLFTTNLQAQKHTSSETIESVIHTPYIDTGDIITTGSIDYVFPKNNKLQTARFIQTDNINYTYKVDNCDLLIVNLDGYKMHIPCKSDTLYIGYAPKIKFINIQGRLYKIEEPTLIEVQPQPKLSILDGSLLTPSWGGKVNY